MGEQARRDIIFTWPGLEPSPQPRKPLLTFLSVLFSLCSSVDPLLTY